MANIPITKGVPLIDLSPMFSGDVGEREALAREVDGHLQRVGFLVVTGHGISPEMISAARTAGKAFFALPLDQNTKYATKVGGRGWLAMGAEANGYSEGTETLLDPKVPMVKKMMWVGLCQINGQPRRPSSRTYWTPI